MSYPLDEILVNAKRDRSGNVAIAALRRRDEDAWDWLVVGENGQPLVFWGTGANLDVEGLVRNGKDGILMVIAATPPGVQPAGLIAAPADEWRSPLLKLISIVTEESNTMVTSPNYKAGPPPPFGPQMITSLLKQFAYQRRDQFGMTEVDASDGKKTSVLIDWNQRPLLFWLTKPDEQDIKALYMAASSAAGIVAVAVDEQLRPVKAI